MDLECKWCQMVDVRGQPKSKQSVIVADETHACELVLRELIDKMQQSKSYIMKATKRKSYFEEYYLTTTFETTISLINDIQNVVAVNPIEQPNAILACVKQLRSTTDATTAASSWTSTIEHLSECESCGMKQKARNLQAKTTSVVLNLQAPNQYLKVTS